MEESHHLFVMIKTCVEKLMPQGYLPGSENQGIVVT
jgi:hypothetical protein